MGAAKIGRLERLATQEVRLLKNPRRACYRGV
jgi:hypothetical protein